MKLKEACEFGEACGLTTVGEAIMNIELHAGCIMAYDKMDAEDLAHHYKEY